MIKLSGYLKPRNLLIAGAITTGILSGCGGETNVASTPRPTSLGSYQVTKDLNRIPQKSDREVTTTELGFVIRQKVNGGYDKVSIGDVYSILLARGKDCLMSVWRKVPPGDSYKPPEDSDFYSDRGCDGSVEFASKIDSDPVVRTPETEASFRESDKEYFNWLQQLGVLEEVPEQKTSRHMQLNPHMYGRNGVLKPQYTS